MPQVINTNVASLNAQRNLNTSQSMLATSLQRLSSGMRINSAKDDAAGLAISERFTSQIRGMNQAVRNANDGISLSQTAEGDLSQVTNNLQRIRELAVQAANGTNTLNDRTTIQTEVAQLISEIDRVAQASSFNGVKLLDGSFANQTFQVGADNNGNNQVTITAIANARSSQLGGTNVYSYTGAAVGNSALLGNDLTLGPTGGTMTAVRATTVADDSVSFSGKDTSAIAKARAINDVSGTTGVSATVNATSSGAAALTAGANVAGTIFVNGVATAALAAIGGDAAATAAVSIAINTIEGQTGVHATDNGTGVTLTAADGRNIQVTLGGTLTAARTGVTVRAIGSEATGTITLKSAADFDLVDGGSTTGAAHTGLTLQANRGTLAASGTAVSTIDVADATGAAAKAAIDIIDAALTTINSSRATLGAVQNRFTSVVSSLQTSSENLSASRSRIQDTDFAAEVAGMTRNQILQQAGTAMLAQANSLPQNVLSLLK